MEKRITNLNKSAFRSDGIARVIENALNDENNRQAFHVIHKLRMKGASYQKIADELISLGIKTRRGNNFSRGAIKQLYDRFLKYCDLDTGAFKEGTIVIDSNKASDFAELKILPDGKVKIVTNFESYKAFSYIDKRDLDFADKAIKTMGRAYMNANREIVVSNFLHTNYQDNDDYHTQYFKYLEEVLDKNHVSYTRYIQIPASVWENLENNLVKDIPFESLIIALSLLPASIKRHIDHCFKKVQHFNLYIIRKQRVLTTFASVDDDVLIQEEFITDKSEKAYSSNITILRSKQERPEDDIYEYILHKKRTLQEIIESDLEKYSEPIPYEIYESIQELLKVFNNGKTSKAEKQRLFRPIYECLPIKGKPIQYYFRNKNGRQMTCEEVFDKVAVILERINKYNSKSSQHKLEDPEIFNAIA